MAGRLKQSARQQDQKDFRTSHAVVIGINDYSNGIRSLTTPVNDAARLARLLEEEHGYQVHLLIENVNRTRLEVALTEELPPLVGEDDRLLYYFAGHGIALDGDDGPQGFLVLQDANAGDRNTLLPMTELHGWLAALRCRHMLAILDCCFAGAFRWAATRRLDTVGLEVIHKERYERFLQSPAWQVLTSAAYDQEALDVVAGRAVGTREEGRGGQHSPFAHALLEALGGKGDLIPKGEGDGLITATELFLFLQNAVMDDTIGARHDQMPGLWPLNRHGRGEYVFLTPGYKLNLPSAPELTDELNPWRGLKSYNQEHSALFFGRKQEIDELARLVREQPFTAVLGASGTGKSSLVKAGVLPHLTGEGEKGTEAEADECGWFILPPLRPGATPLRNLQELLAEEFADEISLSKLKDDSLALTNLIGTWRDSHPNRRLLLVVDQLEELVTLAQDEEREQLLALLVQAVEQHPDAFRLIVTLRTDFEPQFDNNPALASLWKDSRYVLPPLDQADLRQVIEGPASVRVLYFDPSELVDALITEVIQTPGALPLLSFALSEMYIHYLQSGRDNRALTREDYAALGGVIGSLRTRANEEFAALPDDAHRETMQRVMLRMISVEGGELARRRVHKPELVYTNEDENQRVDAVLQQLIDARLLVAGEEEGKPTFEPAHDALVLAWDRLLRWKQDAEQYLPLQRRVAQAAAEWDRAEPGARSGLLWDDDPRLPQLEETLWPTRSKQDGLRGRARWARQVVFPETETPANGRWLNSREVAFVQASVQARARFWRRLMTGLSLFILLLIAATAISLTLQRRAVAAEGVAQTASTRAIEQQLIAESESTRAFEQQGIAEAESTRAIEQQRIAEAESTRAIEQQTIAEVESTRAIEQANVAATRQAEAERQAGIALAQSLAVLAPREADNSVGEDDELGTLLALEAMRLSDEHEGRIEEVLDGALRPLISQSYYANILEERQSPASSVAFSTDSTKLAAAWEDGTILVWDLSASVTEPIALEEHGEGVTVLAFSQDSKTMAAGGEDGLVTLWHAPYLGAEPTRLNVPSETVHSIALSPEGDMMATGTGDSRVLVWELSDPLADPVILETPTGTVRSVAFSPDGKTLASAAKVEGWGVPSNSVLLWQTANLSAEPLVLPVTEGWIESIAFSPDGQTLAASVLDYYPVNPGEMDSQPGTIRAWELSAASASPDILEKHPWAAGSMAFSPDGEMLALGSLDATVRLLPLDGTTAGSVILTGHTGPVVSVTFASDGSMLVSASLDGTLRLWHMSSSAAAPVTLDDHEGLVMSVAFSPDGKTIATASTLNRRLSQVNAGNVRLWQAADPEAGPVTMAQHQGPVYSAAFSPDGETLASVSMVDPVWLWQFKDLESVPTATLTPPEGYQTTPRSIMFSPDGEILALVDSLGQILLWNVTNSHSNPILLEDNYGAATSLAFIPQAQRLVAGTQEGKILVWDMLSLTAPPAILETGYSSITTAAYAPAASLLAAGTAEGTVLIWDISEEGTIPTNTYLLKGHQGPVTSLAFAPDGRRLASGGDDRVVRLWDLSDPSVVPPPVVLAGHSGTVTSLAFGPPDGEMLVSGSTDGTALLWIASHNRLDDIACGLVRRNLTWSEWLRFLPIENEYRCTCSYLPPHPSATAAGAPIVTDSCLVTGDEGSGG